MDSRGLGNGMAVLQRLCILVLFGAALGCAPRVLVVGLDGANWTIVDPLIDAGYLPTIGGIVRSGARADLDCVPSAPASACFCPPVWTTIVTGETVTKHRIFNFFTSSRRRAVPAIWNLVSRYGGHNTLLSFRGTWPPERRAQDVVLTEPGAEWASEQVFDLFPPSSHPALLLPQTLFHPLDLLEQLDILPVDPQAPRLPAWSPLGKDRVAMEVLYELELRRGSKAPWEKTGPDLTVILLHSPDKTEHLVWPLMQPVMWGEVDLAFLLGQAALWDGPEFNPPPFGWTRLPAQYQEADEWLGELLEITEYDYVVFVSDHGMTARKAGLNTGLPGAHDPEHPEAHTGIFSMTGPGIHDIHLGVVSVLDVAPTLAYLLGIPVATDLPGRVLTEAFHLERLDILPVETVSSW